jgi:hypothetical protein
MTLPCDLAVYFAKLGTLHDDWRKTARGDIKMRRFVSLAAFGFGFYYLWYNNDPTTEFVALGAMGAAVLLEFLGAD